MSFPPGGAICARSCGKEMSHVSDSLVLNAIDHPHASLITVDRYYHPGCDVMWPLLLVGFKQLRFM